MTPFGRGHVDRNSNACWTGNHILIRGFGTRPHGVQRAGEQARISADGQAGNRSGRSQHGDCGCTDRNTCSTPQHGAQRRSILTAARSGICILVAADRVTIVLARRIERELLDVFAFDSQRWNSATNRSALSKSSN